MRVLRAKAVRKTLRFYKIVFGIEAPYHVILDGNFIFAAIKFKIDIRDRLSKLFQGDEVKLYVLASILQELEKVGPKAKDALDFAKACCEVISDQNVHGETAGDRLIKLIGNQGINNNSSSSSKTKKYFVVSQDNELRAILASKPGVPLLYLNKVTLVLEPPSQYSQQHNQQVEVSKSDLNNEEFEIVNNASAKQSVETVKSKERVKRKASAPNSLSSLAPQEDSKNSKKRKLAKYK